MVQPSRRIEKQKILSYEAIHYNLRNCNPLEKEYLDYEKLICSGLTTECALVKLRLSEIPPSGPENFPHLQILWERERMQSFTDFCVRYKNKVVFPTLGVPQKMFEFYLNKGFYTLNLEVHYLNMANMSLHRATSAKFHPFTETNKDLLPKVRAVIVGRSSIVFTRKTVVDNTHICKSTNVCKSFVGIDASQLYTYSMCQHMPTGLYTRFEFD